MSIVLSVMGLTGADANFRLLTNPSFYNSVAKTMLKAALSPNPPFLVYFTLEGWMLCGLTSGMSPVHGLFDALCHVILMSLFRLISLFYLRDFSRIIAKCGKENKEKKE